MEGDILMTGATGFLGTEVALELVRDGNATIYVLMRSSSQEAAVHRLKRIWKEVPELIAEIGKRIIPVLGDITKTYCGVGEEEKERLKSVVRYVVHCAAETGVQKSAEELKQINVTGTANVLALAGQIHKKRGLNCFGYVSTAYVAGRRNGRIYESDALPQEFSTKYEETKAQGEYLVQKSGIPYEIFRPSMIVGHSKTGRVQNFNTVYYVLKLLLRDKLSVIPCAKNHRLNMIPVDEVAKSIVMLLNREEGKNHIYHLTAEADNAPTAEMLMDEVQQWASIHLGRKPRNYTWLNAPVMAKVGYGYNKRENAKKKSTLNNMVALAPYFYSKAIFDRSNVKTALGEQLEQESWRNWLEPMLKYAVRKNFMHQTGNNVFEQANIRRNSKTAPVTYHDVTATGITDCSGPCMNQKIEAIRRGLAAMGIGKGKRVAVAAINCTDYLALDMAIGLSGAISIPIYYTTPAGEVDSLLEQSRADCFFIGDRRMMQGIDRITYTGPMIAFANALDNCPKRKNLARWEEFMAAGEGYPLQNVLVDWEDVATIRYTSGTTGKPKGVMFNHKQLAWMGEVMTYLIDWETKNKPMRYLSFLPMSHVVEGILASYAPYYMAGQVDLYYLNDFDALTEALPKVKPTVFFSVPRFYEKLWQQLEATDAGKKYIAMPDGRAKQLLGKVVKQVLLKKAGLQECRQLIVGSAPMSNELLENFRKLGIEIYNAYGQTEAPLISMNAMGDNVLSSIGVPLPDTEIWLEEDGELMVRGPQVSCGYDGVTNNALEQGVLASGDLGEKDAKGHYYLHGRKKDILITSYGKNILAGKVEEHLKNISGVSEAVLIGEQRPFCTALLWLDYPVDDLDLQIQKANEKLSHPEQVKKWTVIETPLSIGAGELTPNLKVRKTVVTEHYRNEIEEMYRK